MTMPFAAQFAVAPITETVEMPAYNAETQMSESFGDCEITGNCWNTTCGWTYWDPYVPAEHDCEVDCNDDSYCL